MIFSRLASRLGLSSLFELGDLDLEVVGDLLQVHALENLADRLGADHRREAVLAVLVHRAQELVLAQQLTVLERRQAGVEHDVGLEIENALEVLERHVEQQADARGQRLQEPDMGDGRGERDMAHALAPHARQRHFDAALLADDALVLHALIFAAQALVVLDRPENARAEQPVALRLERAVVDCLGLLDLAERPGENLLRAGDADLNLIERLRLDDGRERIGDFLIHSCISCGASAALRRSRPALKKGRSGDPLRRKHHAAPGGAPGRGSSLSFGGLGGRRVRPAASWSRRARR